MSNKRIKEIKSLSSEELSTKIQETEKTLFYTRMKKVGGELKDTAMLWRLRKDLARMKMLTTKLSSGQAR